MVVKRMVMVVMVKQMEFNGCKADGGGGDGTADGR